MAGEDGLAVPLGMVPFLLTLVLPPVGPATPAVPFMPAGSVAGAVAGAAGVGAVVVAGGAAAPATAAAVGVPPVDDATAGVVHDWMYETLTREYVLDETNQEFLRQSNPWALRGMIERLTEAADRGLWAEPDAQLMDQMRQLYLDVEGDLEDAHGD